MMVFVGFSELIAANARKGQAHTRAWMDEHCKLIVTDSDNVVGFVKDIAQQISKLQETPDGSCQVSLSSKVELPWVYFLVFACSMRGFNAALAEEGFSSFTILLRYALVLMDVTVYPANAKLVSSACDALGVLVNMGNQNVGHVQLPVCHTNTSSQIVYKHRRVVEDNVMLNQKLDISQTVTLHFSRPDESHASDKRGGVQNCLFVTSDPSSCTWVSPQVVGPVQLARVRDMLGFDSDQLRPPGATARAEQILVLLTAIQVFV